MSKNNFRFFNFCLMILSVFCICTFIIASENYKDNIILYIFGPLFVLSTIIEIVKYIKEDKSKKDIITLNYLKNLFIDYSISKKGNLFCFFISMIAGIIFCSLYEHGFYLIPFCFYCFFNAIYKQMEIFDKK